MNPLSNEILYGVAYYPEYMPYDRIDTDMQMMKKAGINTIRIAESSWSSYEPTDGAFDFSVVRKTLAAANRHGLYVIVGTPTYAIPAWLAQKYPDILTLTHKGQSIYGHRQNMDISHEGYLFHAERVIRGLMEVCAQDPAVIGYQLDNETKHYDTAGPHVQQLFVEYLKEKFGTPDAMNAAFGLTYWSNRIARWEDFPDVRGTINGSLDAEFQAFQRTLVTKFLTWQANIVKEYARDDQFLTQNFDFAWTDHSVGLQPFIEQRSAAKALTVTGVDIYHPSAAKLTGAEISMGGAIGRSIKKAPYIVLETEAQGNPGWLPYPGQLRLQAYSHLASGAQSVMYWHWHSIHNAIETYWKGVLSHDFSEGETYQEVCRIGKEFSENAELLSYHPVSRCAMLLDNRSLTGLEEFPIGGLNYNQIMRWLYDALYRMNISCDMIYPEDVMGTSASALKEQYPLLIVPGLYSATEALCNRLSDYVKEGGHMISTFRSFFSNEYLSVHPKAQPCNLTECFGMTYDQFTIPDGVSLQCSSAASASVSASAATSTATSAAASAVKISAQNAAFADTTCFMELLRPLAEDTEVIMTYDHPAYRNCCAATFHPFGDGSSAYIGCYFEGDEKIEHLLTVLLQKMGIAIPSLHYPMICKECQNNDGEKILYLLNFSGEEKTCFIQEYTGNADDSGTITLVPYDAKVIHLT